MQKNNLEKSYQENSQVLREVRHQLEQEKTDKQRLEFTRQNLDHELQTIREQLQQLKDEKYQLNQRCLRLEHERDQQGTNEPTHFSYALSSLLDTQLRALGNTQVKSHDDELEKIQIRHREELKILSAENEDLHRQKKELLSDLDLHKDTIDVTVRYKLDLQKAIDEKTSFQREVDRLKQEKDLLEQERLEYKSKYDGLQEEIRLILADRSKLERKLTEELSEHFHEKQRTTDHSNQYRMEIEQLNLKLVDAEVRLHTFEQTNRTPSQQQQQQRTVSASLDLPSNIVDEEKHVDLNRTYPRENYLIQNSRVIRSNTQRVKSELDRLRHEFDQIVSNYEPTSNIQEQQQQSELRSKIETFRHFYEQEFRRRQSTKFSSSRLLSSSMIEPTFSEKPSQPIRQLPRQASALLTTKPRISSADFLK